MLAERRRLTRFEMEQIINENSAILGLKFNNKRIVKDIIEKLKSEVIGLNTRVDGNYITRRQDRIRVIELPQMNKNIREVTQWAAYQYKPDLTKELGTIAANDDTIVLNLNHAVSDGKYIVGLAEHIADKPKKLSSFLPISFEEEFNGNVKERAKKPAFCYMDDVNNTVLRKLEGVYGKEERVCERKYNVQSFSNYDPKKKTCKGLTPAIVTGLSLAINAFQGDKIIKNIGGSMAANMRGELKSKPTLNHCNIFTMIPGGAFVTNYTPISECFNRISERIKHNFDIKDPLWDFCDVLNRWNPKINLEERITICFSHLGPINVKAPVEDLYLYNIDYAVPFSTAVPLLTYTINDPRTDRNEFHSMLRYHGNRIPEKHAGLLSDSLKHFLQTFKLTNTVGGALEEMKIFQAKIAKQ